MWVKNLIGIFLKYTHKHIRTNFVLIFYTVELSPLDYAETHTHTKIWINAIFWAQAKVGKEFWGWERVLEVERAKCPDRDKAMRLF